MPPAPCPALLPLCAAGELPDDSKVTVDSEGSGLTFAVAPDESAAAARAAELEVRLSLAAWHLGGCGLRGCAAAAAQLT